MNDEYNNESNMYHYNYREEPRPQDDYRPTQSVYESSYQPVEEPVKYRKKTGKKGGRIVALVLACALISGLCGFGGAMLAKNVGKDN